jgi:hypothetical protein
MTRIVGTDNAMNMIAKMSDGNPGALGVLMGVVSKGKEIDPMDFMNGMGAILNLDTLGVYGTGIYILCSDQCGGDIREFMMLLRANQMGFVSDERMKAVAADQTDKVRFTKEEMDDFNKQVCEQIPDFKKRE